MPRPLVLEFELINVPHKPTNTVEYPKRPALVFMAKNRQVPEIIC
jgi:hypothetical protein